MNFTLSKGVEKCSCAVDIVIKVLFGELDTATIVDKSSEVNTPCNFVLLDDLGELGSVSDISGNDSQRSSQTEVLVCNLFEQVGYFNLVFF